VDVARAAPALLFDLLAGQLGRHNSHTHRGDTILRPPIVIVEGLDITVYATIADAALAVEGPDAIAGTNDVYDADGFRLELRSAGGPLDYNSRVSVVEPPVACNASAELSARLREYLGELGEVVPPGEELELLIARVATHQESGR
jgi:hypothetical protein